MDTVEGVPKSLIHWSSAFLVGILLFSLGFFFFLRIRELRLARERVVFMDWDGVTSIAWIVTAAALLLVSILTYLRIDGYRGWTLGERLNVAWAWTETDPHPNRWERGHEHSRRMERRQRELKDVSWQVATPLLAALSVGAWVWTSTKRAKLKWRGPARDSRWLLIPIAVTAALLVVIGFAYRRAFWTPVDPHFDTSGISSK